MNEKENSYKEAHGTGFIGTMVFMAIAIAIMILVRYFLNY